MQEAVSHSSAALRGEPFHALLLGVTPDLARMEWPQGARLMAVDYSFPMTRSVWPGDLPGKRAVVCANWLSMPRAASSCDVVLGDGSMNCLRYPSEFQRAAEIVSGMLRDDGVFALRCYLRGEPAESTDDVYEDLLRGNIGGFHAFKLRLFMALQVAPECGVRVHDAYQSWAERNLDKRLLPQGEGWEEDVVDTIQFYRGRDTVYSFPTLAELRSAMLPWLEETSLSTGGYELGERCPTLVYRPRRNAARS
jgi:hypothetical protein